ncbi:MAG: hypothetical protein EPN93_08105 [Spirochaetes bacterium]|nr:MAG: hypothetical protein EPN93_08105 [Spirochaetota bacterium]
MKTRNVVAGLLLITTALVAGPRAVESQTKERFKQDVEKQKDIGKKDIELVKMKVEVIRQEIVRRNYKFKVDITEAIKRDIKEITGLEVPRGVEKEARVQSSLGNQMFQMFLKKLAEAERAKKKKKRPEKTEPEKRAEEPEEKVEPDANERRDEGARTDETEEPAGKDKVPVEEPKKEPALAPDADPKASSFSWVRRGKVTPVKFQENCGSCWAFSSVAVVESSALIVNNREMDLSEQFLVDCAVDKSGRDAGSCGGGWYGYAFDFLTRSSPVDEASVPYGAREQACRKGSEVPLRIAAWGYVQADAGNPSVDEMKAALCKYGPLAACIKATPAFQAYRSGVFDEFASTWGPRDINHGIVIVGWDDSKKSYLIKNSWSTDWGEDGYGWVEYGCNNIGFGAAWVVVEGM